MALVAQRQVATSRFPQLRVGKRILREFADSIARDADQMVVSGPVELVTHRMLLDLPFDGDADLDQQLERSINGGKADTRLLTTNLPEKHLGHGCPGAGTRRRWLVDARSICL